MSRANVVFSVVLFWASGSALAQTGQVMSYHVMWNGTETVLVPQVSSSGFILTDVINGEPDGSLFQFIQLVGQTSEVKLIWPGGETGKYIALTSGIPFAPGSAIKVIPSVNGGHTLTISGYVPTTAASGNVPTVGGVGLVFMVLLLLVVGGGIIRRRKACT